MKCRTIRLLIVLQLLSLNVIKSISQEHDNVNVHQDGPDDLEYSVLNTYKQGLESQHKSVGKRQNDRNVNFLQQQMSRITTSRSRSRTGRNRIHEALIRARWQQLSDQGLTDKQLKTQEILKNELTKLSRRPRWTRCYTCETSYSISTSYPLYSSYSKISTSSVGSYSASQIHYLQTTVNKLTSNVQKLTLKLEDLQTRKEESEERMLRMEKTIQQLQTRNREQLDYSIDVADELDEEILAIEIPSNEDSKDRRSILNECLTRIQKLENAVLKVNESVQNMKHSSKRDHEEQQNNDGSKTRTDHVVVNTGNGILLNQIRLNLASITNLTRISASQQETTDKQKTLIDVLQNRMLFQRQQLIEANSKNDEQDKILKAITTNRYIQVSDKVTTEPPPLDNITTQPPLVMATADNIKEVVNSVDDLRKVMNSHEKSITRLYIRLRNTQRCCRISTVVAKRIGIVERRIKEARTRADSSLRVAKGNRKRIDSMTGKLETQKILTKELQTASRDHDQLASQSNQRITELIESYQKALNETMRFMSADYTMRSERNFEKITETQKIINNLNTNLEYMNVFMNEQVLQLNVSKYDLEVLKVENSIFKSKVQKSLVRTQDRISAKEKELKELLLTVADMQMQVNHHEDDMQNHTKEIQHISNHVEKNKEVLAARGKMETKLNGDVENIFQIMRSFRNNLTELVTVSRFYDNQMKELRSIVQAIQSLNEISDGEIRSIDRKLTELENQARDMSIRFSDEITAVYSDSTQSSSYAADMMASMNLTLQNYRAEQSVIQDSILRSMNENRDRVLDELGKRTTNIENQQNKISKTLKLQAGNTSSRIVDLENELNTNKNSVTRLNTRLGNVENKLTNLETTVFGAKGTKDALEWILERTYDTQEELNRTQKFFAEELQSFQILLQEMEKDTVANLSNGIMELWDYVVQQNKTLNNQEVERQKANSLLINRFVDLDVKCGKQSEKIIADVNKLRNELDLNIETLFDECDVNIAKIKQRVFELERSNSSIHSEVANGIQEISTIKAGLGDLRETEKIVSEALSTHNTVKTSHEYLRHNLSVVSNKVQKIMNEQGIALTIVQEVMNTLNQSILERQNTIDKTISARIGRNAEELVAVQKIMRNFTTVITRVLKSQISQNISHVNIQRQQRTVVESIDFHDATITDLLATNRKLETLVEGVRAQGKAFNLQMRNLVSDTENHERRLRVLDIADVALNQRVQKLNETQINTFSELRSSIEKLEQNVSNLNRISQSGKEGDAVFREVLNHSISELRVHFINLQTVARSQNVSLKEINQKSQRESSQVQALTLQVNEVLETVRSVSYLRQTLRETRNNVSDQLQTVKQSLKHNSEITSKCNQSYSHLEDYINQMKSQIDIINTSLSDQHPASLVASLCAYNDDFVKKQSETMSDLKSHIAKLNTNDELLTHNISAMILSLEEVDATAREVKEHESSIKVLQSTTTQFSRSLNGLRNAARAQSNTLRRMDNNNADVISLVQTLQKHVLDQDSKITQGTQKIERKVSSLAQKINSKSKNQTSEMESGRLHKITEDLRYNLTVLENRLYDIAYNVEANYNTTQLVQVILDEHEVKLSDIRSSVKSETYALVTSIASSVASLETSLVNINFTTSNDIKKIEELLEIFQLAFDTSNRQVAKYGEEIEIINVNTSNQFNHFDTIIEYLTQIVKESSEAMTENTERINLLNETLHSEIFGPMRTSLKQANDSTNQLTLSLNGGESYNSEEGGYKQDGTDDGIPDSFNLEAVLNGDADSFRIHRRTASWMNSEPSLEEEDYAENYDFASLERRKRVVKDVRKIGAQVTNVTEQIEHLRNKIKYLQNITRHCQRHISFSAGRTKRFICCGVVRFDKVFTNHEKGYDATTGKFKASVQGNYFFMAAITQRNKFVSTVIVKNGEPQVSIRMDHAGGNYEQSQSTNSVILFLATGDQVWMETNAGSLEGYQYPAVTFSGFMIM